MDGHAASAVFEVFSGYSEKAAFSSSVSRAAQLSGQKEIRINSISERRFTGNRNRERRPRPIVVLASSERVPTSIKIRLRLADFPNSLPDTSPASAAPRR